MKARALLCEWVLGVVFGPILMIFGVEIKDWTEVGVGAAFFVVSAVMWAFWRQGENRDKAAASGEQPSPTAAD